MQKLSIVIPCHNERASIETLLSRVLAVALPAGWEREVIVVDDASNDGTAELLPRLPIRVIYREENGGKGAALVDGFAIATGTHFLIQDADLEYAPEDIPSLLSALTDSRLVVYGSRNMEPEKRRGSRVLRLGVGTITWLINTLYGTKLTDACSCHRLFPREAAPLFPRGGFEADILFTPALTRAGYRITEVPVSYAPRTIAEGKKIKYRDGIYALAAIFIDYWRPRRSGIITAPILKGQ